MARSWPIVFYRENPLVKLSFVFLLLLFQPLNSKIKFGSNQSGITFTKQNSKLMLEAPMTDVSGRIVFKDDDPDRVTGANALSFITFDNGTTGTAGHEYKTSGTFEPFGSDLLSLRNDEGLEVENKVVSQIVKVADNNESFIKGSPIFTQPIQLGPNSTLNLGINGILYQTLDPQGSNTVKLTDSLKMGLATPLNSGTLNILDLNGFEIFFNNALSEISSIQGVGTVHFLRGKYQVSNDLTFNGTVDVNGQESSMSFDSGKSISFGPGLHDLIDVELKGMDLTTTFSVDPAGTVFLSNVTIILNGDMTLSGQGEIVVLGNNCKIVPNGYKIFLDNGTRFVVDSTTLLYEPNKPLDPIPFEVIDSGSGPGVLELSNNGQILSTKHGLSIQADLDVSETNFVTESNWQLTSSSVLIFSNQNPGSNKAVTFDGDGYFVQFPPGDSSQGLLEIGENVSLTIENTNLKDFNPDSILFADSNSSLEFGQGTSIDIASDKELTTIFPWVFSGDSSLNGFGKTLILKNPDVIQVKNGSTLLVKNTTLKIEDPGAFLNSDDSSLICFQDCTIILDQNGLELSSGNYSFKGLVNIFGGDQTSVLGTAGLTFSSKGSFIVSTLSELSINKGIVLTYKADPSGDGSETRATKRHFILTDPSSKLILNGCGLVSTATALALDFGTVIISDNVKLKIDTSPAAEVELGTDLLVDILAGGALDVDGPLRYVPTTFIP